ncbi:MAG TPA: JAB domain-containing protein [Burkholderiales bacterium]|nr:JAB domain-containing protein [Burkholderiales bacterium]
MTSDNSRRAKEERILRRAAAILERRLLAPRGPKIHSSHEAKQFVALRLAHEQREVILAIWLDADGRVLAVEEAAFGTVHKVVLHPRELVRSALRLNACRLIIAHNHPGGSADFSKSDRILTESLRHALSLIDVEVLDHLLIGERVVSLAEIEASERAKQPERAAPPEALHEAP